MITTVITIFLIWYILGLIGTMKMMIKDEYEIILIVDLVLLILISFSGAIGFIISMFYCYNLKFNKFCNKRIEW